MLAIAAHPVELAFRWRPFLRDADDDMVLETAVNGGAAAIVTMNARDFDGAMARFGIEVWAPAIALAEVESER